MGYFVKSMLSFLLWVTLWLSLESLAWIRAKSWS